MPGKVEKSSEGDLHQFVSQLKEIIQNARSKSYSAINFAQVEANWLIGRQIVEQEQKGQERAEYGKRIIRIASEELAAEFGKGYSETNLRNFRKFYLLFNELQIQQALPDELGIEIQQALPAKSIPQISQATPDQSGKKNVKSRLLSWTHYERLLRVDNPEARDWYMREAAEQMWSYRTWYSVLKGSEQLFATKYKVYLPTVEELSAEIERQKAILEIQFKKL